MKELVTSLLLVVFFLTVFTGCKPDATEEPKVKRKGQVVFWTDADPGATLTVTINDLSRPITRSTTAPACGAAGSATFELWEGTYTYSATITGGVTLTGNVTIIGGECLEPVRLSFGRAMFWTDVDPGAALTVTIITGPNIPAAGISRPVSSFTTTAPACGATGSATFVLTPGIYTYTAVITGGVTLSGQVSVSANGCTQQKLILGRAVFYVTTAPSIPVIVRIGDVTRTINAASTLAPTCSTPSANAVTFILPPGIASYSYSVGNNTPQQTGTITIPPAGGCITPQNLALGQAVFYSSLSARPITVTIAGLQKSFTSNPAGAVPTCGVASTNSAIFTLPPSTTPYSYSVSGAPAANGTVLISSSACASQRLQ